MSYLSSDKLSGIDTLMCCTFAVVIFSIHIILTTIRDVCKCVLTIGRKSLRAFVIPLQSSLKFVYP